VELVELAELIEAVAGEERGLELVESERLAQKCYLLPTQEIVSIAQGHLRYSGLALD
jgi:hypothetical protein